MGTPTHIWMCWGATDGTADNTGTGAMCVLVPAQANPAEKIRCEVKPHNGKTTVFVNGVPKFPMAFTSYYPEQYRYRQMAEQGKGEIDEEPARTGMFERRAENDEAEHEIGERLERNAENALKAHRMISRRKGKR